ncbi:MAG: serine--tRNA ligase [Spirochaetota bacterium]
MLDINTIVTNPEVLKEMIEKRGLESAKIVDELHDIINRKRKLQKEADTLRAERNRVSKEIGILKSKKEDASELMNSMRHVGDKIKEIQEHLEVEERRMVDLNLSLPNLLQEDVPLGKSEKENVTIRTYGEKPKFDFKPMPHFEIGEKLGILDFERGIKIAGSRAYTYRGLAASLERALMNFMMDANTREFGYEETWVPMVVNDDSMTTTGQYPKFKDEYYRIDKDHLNLIPTAEVPLTNLYRDEIIPEANLPIHVTAFTSCFRREAGAHGKDTRGLIRVHQFQKIELVKFCKPEDSEKEHHAMLDNVEQLLQRLGLHYKVLLLCSGDTSGSSSKTYDLEVWMPGLGRYLEISSVSNFLDFQARRGKIRYKGSDKKNHLVHTINGSGLALGRAMAAILENYQTEDGKFAIPECLQKYMP